MRAISILGDSISTFEGANPAGYAVFYQGGKLAEAGLATCEDTWWQQVAHALGGRVIANSSWSGSMVEGAGFPACASAERVAALSHDGEAPDDVIVYCGINDYGWGGADAQRAGHASAVPFDTAEPESTAPRDPGDAPADAAERFGAAYRSMLLLIRMAYPKARVWALTPAAGRVRGCGHSTFPRSFRGVPFDAYRQAVLSAAAHTGCIGCDLDAFGFDYEGIEGTHPTKRGMRQLAWLALAAMGQAVAGEAGAADEAVAGEAAYAEAPAAKRGAAGAEAPASERTAAAGSAGDPSHAALAPAPSELGPFPGGVSFRSSDPCDRPGRSCVGCPHALDTGRSWMHVCQRATAPRSEHPAASRSEHPATPRA